MIRKLMLAVAAMMVTMGSAFAQVEVNKADAAALDSVKGIGPKTSKLIIDERAKGGDFKDWADFEKRIKGIGANSAKKLSMAGLQVAGKPLDGADSKMAEPKAAKPDAKPAKGMPDAKPAAKPATAAAPAKM